MVPIQHLVLHLVVRRQIELGSQFGSLCRFLNFPSQFQKARIKVVKNMSGSTYSIYEVVVVSGVKSLLGDETFCGSGISLK